MTLSFIDEDKKNIRLNGTNDKIEISVSRYNATFVRLKVKETSE